MSGKRRERGKERGRQREGGGKGRPLYGAGTPTQVVTLARAADDWNQKHASSDFLSFVIFDSSIRKVVNRLRSKSSL